MENMRYIENSIIPSDKAFDRYMNETYCFDMDCLSCDCRCDSYRGPKEIDTEELEQSIETIKRLQEEL